MTRSRFAASLVTAVLATTGLARSQTVTTVMSGLDSPRGLAFAPNGALYVAEAGRGGNGPSLIIRGETYRYGATGAVSRLFKGKQERIAAGLPSLLGGTSGDVTGPHDVSMLGVGEARITIGMGFDPARRGELGEVGALLGRLARVLPNGKWRLEDDLAAHELNTNPDGGLVDSNPFGLLSLPGGFVYADAGANAVMSLTADGTIETLATFPTIPNTLPFGPRDLQPVPTSVTVGPDGAYYVGQLSGFPFPVNAASVYRLVPGEAPTVFLSDFTTILDLDFAPDGSLYVLQHTSAPVLGGVGSVVHIAPDGTRTTILGGLTRPTSLVVGPDGAIYVSNKGTSIGGGEVLRIVP